MAVKKTEEANGGRYVSRSLLWLAWKKFRAHPLAKWGGAILGVLYGVMVFAEFVAPYNFKTDTKRKPYCRPVTVHFFDEYGRFHLRPFVYNYRRTLDPETFETRYVEDRTTRYPLTLFAKGDRYQLWGIKGLTWDRHLFGIEQNDDDDDDRPMLYLWGSDEFGRDLLSRVIWGARVSLTIGLVGFAITFTIGMIMGGVSGYFGGGVDLGVQRLCEMLMLFPFFYLLLTLRAAIPASLDSRQIYFAITIIMSVIGWAGIARVIRGMVLSVAQREYALAARALGVGHFRIITRHILPNTFSYAIVAATVSIPAYMIGESGLSFLNLGIQEPYASWGNMLSAAQAVTEIKYHPWVLIPGAMIFVAVVAFQFLGDGLRDAFDPKMGQTVTKGQFEALRKKLMAKESSKRHVEQPAPQPSGP